MGFSTRLKDRLSVYKKITVLKMTSQKLFSLFVLAVACFEACRAECAGEDREPYCGQQPGRLCYHALVPKECCNKCTGLATGPAGCEYGDKTSWCTKYKKEDCDYPGVRESCCNLCAEGDATTAPPATTTAPPATTTAPPATT